MARSNTGSASNWYSNANAIVSAAPLSISCHFYPTSLTATTNLVVIGDSGGNGYFALVFDGANSYGSGASKILCDVAQTGSSSIPATTTAAGAANAWYHAGFVGASATSHAVFLNGGGKGTNATSRTPTGINHVDIGAYRTSGTFSPLTGRMAEVGIWNVALSDAEMLELSKGASPLLIRPDNLRAYWPLIGRTAAEPDLIGNFHLTQNGTMAQAEHVPNIVYPSSQIWTPFIAVAGGTTLTPSAGLATFAGNAPAVATILVPSAGLATFTGNAPTVTSGTFLTPAAGVTTFTGQVPAIARILAPTAGATTWAGNAPALGNVQEIAFDSASAVQVLTGTRTSDSWTYTPTGAIRSVVLLAMTGNNTDMISGCTYGGVAMTRPSGGSVSDNTGEPMRSYAYHLGSGIPAGAQSVVINYTASTASPFRAMVLGFTAAGDVEVLSVGMQGGDAANPSRTPAKSGRVGLTVAVLASGHDDATSHTPGSGLTEVAFTDLGTFTASFVYQTDADAVDTPAAWTATIEDVALVAIAIGQSVPAGITPASASIAVDGNSPELGGTVLTPSAGLATFSGQVPAVARILAPAAGAVTFSGNAPAIQGGTFLTPTAGAVTWTGQAPTLAAAVVLAPSAGVVTFTGQAPAVAKTLVPSVGAVTWTGKVPRVIDQYPDVTLSWTAPVGWTPTEYRVKIGTSPGVYTTTIDVPASQTSVDVYGLSYNVRYYWTVVGVDASDVEQEVAPEGNFMLMMPGTGTVTFDGKVPVLPKTLAAVSGAVTWVGNFPSVQSGAGTFLTPATGVTTFTGQVPSIPKMLAPAAGAAIFTGQIPSFITGNFLAPAAGLVTFSGFAPTVPRFITPSAGLATWTGQTPSISLAITLTPSPGMVMWTGNAPEIRGALLPAAGSVIWTGNRPAISQGAQDVVPRFGGDDAPGWQKAEWRKRRAKELAMEEDIRALYRKLRGVPELKEEAAAVVQEIMPARPARKSRPEPDWRMLSAEMERALREIELRRLELQFEYDELAAILILTALA